MTVRLDDAPLVLEDLDFTPACEAPVGDRHPATVAIRCRACHAVRLICVPHLEWLRASLLSRTRFLRVVTCTNCGAQAKHFDDISEVVPL